MQLYNDTNPRFIEASFVWERYAPLMSYVHAYGCRNSKRRNQQRGSRSRDVYCGSYQLLASAIRGLENTTGLPEVATADVIHCIENNEIAHASLQIRLRDTVPEDDLEGVKTAIVDRIWNCSRGPLRHACSGDKDLKPHPNANLTLAPLGPFVANISIAQQVWRVARYWWSYLVWKFQAQLRS